jgi:hypothetical protein
MAALAGVVYFIFDAERRFLKIGYTTNLRDRMANIRWSSCRSAAQFTTSISLWFTIPGTKALEKRLHQRFAASRVFGEWFDATPWLVEQISALQEANR